MKPERHSLFSVAGNLLTLAVGAWLLAAPAAVVVAQEEEGIQLGIDAPAGAAGAAGEGDLGFLRKALAEGDPNLLIQSELEFALETAHRRIAELESALAEEEQGDVPLESALAAANREADQYRIRYRDLLVRVESLGLETVRSEKALQDRLIKAVRERQQYVDKQQVSMGQLLALSEAVLNYLKTATNTDPETRLQLEGELRKTDEVLGFGSQQTRYAAAKTPELNEGRIVSYKKEYDLAVLNVGRPSGVRVGMPLNIFRKDRLVGTALVVMVRDEISGAIVQDIFKEGDRVQVQDRIEARTANTIKL